MNSEYIVYLLKCDNSGRTYIGSTNNLSRRIRQHNGEISGGASATHGESWSVVFYISGFRDKIEALQAEWRFKRPTGYKNGLKEYSGVQGRLKGLRYIFDNSVGWTSKSQPFSDKYNCWILPEYSQYIDGISRLETVGYLCE